MPTCVAYGCTNRSSKEKPNVTFHRFPKNTQLRKEWVKACRRANWKPSDFSVLCSEHFTEDQIDRTSTCCVRLRENAVPNIFKGFPSYLQKKLQKSRKPPTKIDTPVTLTRTQKAVNDSSISTSKVKKSRKLLKEIPPITSAVIEKTIAIEPSPTSPELQTFYFKNNGTCYTFYERQAGGFKKRVGSESSLLVDDSTKHSVAESEENVLVREDTEAEFIDESDKSTSDAEAFDTEVVDKLDRSASAVEALDTEFVDELDESASVVEAFDMEFVDELDGSVSLVQAFDTEVVDESEGSASVVEDTDSEFVNESEESASHIKNISTESRDKLEENVEVREPTNDFDLEDIGLVAETTNKECIAEMVETGLIVVNANKACAAESIDIGSGVQATDVSLVPGPHIASVTREACTSPPQITSAEQTLKSKVEECEDMITCYRRKIRTLNQQLRRFKSRFVKMNSLFEDSKQTHLMEANSAEVLNRPIVLNEQFLTWKLAKLKDEIRPTESESPASEYAPKLQTFDLTLRFHSADAYECVRETFLSHLPHSVRFPKNTQQQKAWVEACRRANWMPTQFSSLCSEHFSEDQIDRTSLSYVRLRENAIPNIFKDFPVYFKNGKKRKKVPNLRNAPVTSTKCKKIPKARKILDDVPEIDEIRPYTPEVQTFNFKRNGAYYTFYEDKYSALKKAVRTESKNADVSNEDLVAELEESASVAESTNIELEEIVSFEETTNTEIVDELEESLPQSTNAVFHDDLEENVLGLEPTNNCAAISEENKFMLETINEENAKLKGTRSVIATNNTYSLHTASSTSEIDYQCSPSPERISVTEVLESKVKEYEGKIMFYKKKIEMLHLETHRFKSKIEKINSLYEELKHKQLTETEAMEMLSRSTGSNEQFLVWKLSKIKNEIIPNENVPNDDPEESKTFDLTLHFYSPKTYEYVRDTFQTHLPYTIK